MKYFESQVRPHFHSLPLHTNRSSTPVQDEFAQFLNASRHPPRELRDLGLRCGYSRYRGYQADIRPSDVCKGHNAAIWTWTPNLQWRLKKVHFITDRLVNKNGKLPFWGILGLRESNLLTTIITTIRRGRYHTFFVSTGGWEWKTKFKWRYYDPCTHLLFLCLL